MKIDDNNNTPKRSNPKPKHASEIKSDKGKSFWSKLKFWVKEDDDTLDTFSSKYQKAQKKHKRKMMMYIALFLIIGGSVTSIAMSSLNMIDMSKDEKVKSSKLSDDDSDLAADAILKGKPIKVPTDDKKKSESQTKSDKEKADKEVKEAVDKAVKEADDKNKEQLDKLQKQVDDLSKANKDLTSQNSELTKQKDDLSKQKDDANKQKSTSDSSANDYKKKYDDANAQLDKLKNELTSVQSQLDAKTTDYNNLKKVVDEWNSQPRTTQSSDKGQ